MSLNGRTVGPRVQVLSRAISSNPCLLYTSMGIIGMAAFMFIGICMAFIMAVTPVGEAGVGANGADSRQRRRTGKMPVQQPSRALHGG